MEPDVLRLKFYPRNAPNIMLQNAMHISQLLQIANANIIQNPTCLLMPPKSYKVVQKCTSAGPWNFHRFHRNILREDGFSSEARWNWIWKIFSNMLMHFQGSFAIFAQSNHQHPEAFLPTRSWIGNQKPWIPQQCLLLVWHRVVPRVTSRRESIGSCLGHVCPERAVVACA